MSTIGCGACGSPNRSKAMFCANCAVRLPGFAPTGLSALGAMKPTRSTRTPSSGPTLALLPAERPSFWIRLGLLMLAMGVVFLAWLAYVTREASGPPASAPVAATPAPAPAAAGAPPAPAPATTAVAPAAAPAPAVTAAREPEAPRARPQRPAAPAARVAPPAAEPAPAQASLPARRARATLPAPPEPSPAYTQAATPPPAPAYAPSYTPPSYSPPRGGPDLGPPIAIGPGPLYDPTPRRSRPSVED